MPLGKEAALAVGPVMLAGQGGNRVAELAWLAGCWERSAGARVIVEQWTRPRGGGLIFAASPSGQAPAEFESTSASDTAVTFANATHDFPQRIRYRRRGTDPLLASVEGTLDGWARSVDFPDRRVICPCARAPTLTGRPR